MRIFVYNQGKLVLSSNHLYPHSFEDIFIEIEEQLNLKRGNYRFFLLFEDGDKYEIIYPCIKIDTWQWDVDFAVEIKPSFSWYNLWNTLLGWMPRLNDQGSQNYV